MQSFDWPVVAGASIIVVGLVMIVAFVRRLRSADVDTRRASQSEQPKAASGARGVELYNEAVRHYKGRDLASAEKAFSRCVDGDHGDGLRMVAAYARGLAQRQLGRAIEIPDEFREVTDAVGTRYCAATAAGRFSLDDFRAEVSGDGCTDVWIGDKRYRVAFSSVLSMMSIVVTRFEGDQKVVHVGMEEDDNPCIRDDYVMRVAREVGAGDHAPVEMGVRGAYEGSRRIVTNDDLGRALLDLEQLLDGAQSWYESQQGQSISRCPQAPEIREIGAALDDVGGGGDEGFRIMQAAADRMSGERKRNVEIVWSGVGRWLS